VKFPRWLVTLLVVVNVTAVILAIAGWLVWPTITARRFVGATERGEFELANRLLANGQWSVGRGSVHLRIRDASGGTPTGFGWGLVDPTTSKFEIAAESMSMNDLLNGTRRLRLVRVEGHPSNLNDIWFEAGFGSVWCDWYGRKPN
jgi:hypothetical protein